MTLTSTIQERIAREGPLPFSAFMQDALYHPQLGYYTRQQRQIWGRAGDYFTAAQLQPTFGSLVRRMLEAESGGFVSQIFEIGSGSGALAESFAEANYQSVEALDNLPRLTGHVFSNELFDALPVDIAVCRNGTWLQRMVCSHADLLEWCEQPITDEWQLAYLQQYAGEATQCEIPVGARTLLANLAAQSHNTVHLHIDYGFTTRERIRFAHGSLLAYQQHQTSQDILSEPGTRDLTAHVDFTWLQDEAARLGFHTLRFETLQSAILRAFEPEALAALLNDVRTRQQYKRLLIDFGASFYVWVARK